MRWIATDGLACGIPVEYAGTSISIPVGDQMLGRAVDVLEGRSMTGPYLIARKLFLSHRYPPPLKGRGRRPKVLSTGIQGQSNLLAPYIPRGKDRPLRGSGVGKKCSYNWKMIHNNCEQAGGYHVFAGVGERSREGNELISDMTESGVIDMTMLVFGQMTRGRRDPVEDRPFRADSGGYLRDVKKQDVLLLLDYTYTICSGWKRGFGAAGEDAGGGRIPADVGRSWAPLRNKG